MHFAKDNSYISGRNKNLLMMLFEILLLCIFPYPGYEKKIFIPLRIHFQTIDACYNLGEILYCLMFLRFFIILRALINYSQFQNDRGREYCQSNNVKSNLRFLIKCLVQMHPIRFIVCIAITSLFILSITFRIFERPVDDYSNLYYNNPMNAI